MKSTLSSSLFMGLALVSLSVAAQDATLPKTFEDPSSVDVQITAHVVEPKAVEPPANLADRVKLPAGFQIEVFADKLINPRMLAMADNGAVYVTRRSVGDVLMLRDNDGDGQADQREVVASRPQMHGIAVQGSTMYLVTVNELYRADIGRNGTLGELELLLDDLPDAGQHPNRTLVVGPDGKLYLSVGSTCNACGESNIENATMLQVEPDGSKRSIYASGLRNTIGFGFHPVTGELFGMDHGIDWLGDNVQHEELNHILKGEQYGWPYIYADSRHNPQDQPPGDISMDTWAEQSREPVGYYTPHAAPMQLAFYTADQFPEAYHGDAFVAMRGSWNRKPPSGYEVVRVLFDEAGKPTGFEPFLTGFLSEKNEEQASGPGPTWTQTARLAGVTVANDGALLVSDDSNGIIYRISYTGEAASGADASPGAFTNSDGANVRVSPGAAAGTLAERPAELSHELVNATDTDLNLKSPAFEHDASIPQKFGAEGENISPPLSWEKGPEGTESYVIFMEDPGVSKKPPFVHWLVYNLPPDVNQLREGIPAAPLLADPKGTLQGQNDRGALGYFGPRPPKGQPAHSYHFQVMALDTTLELPFGATRAELLEAVEGHVLARGGLVGTFKR
ncbi:YbhB/YbcL family Raf kinase inhibitor-like protein [Hydrocarboniclastica marina]|uniref:YbhB/YbcL family Raf kinase inhibitor-like protein n=1 Tax=Hydrocarboniclastica marina TaxID=2259620 RepID=A0A4P7XJ77_9ALTE|nr:YbhB/YbcL family Raf kinase inhibitor-like protein [Hydrocarboniclastica marina]QCF26813.1 YbhB/YbcL family Raf kinase inhibitor-like protein [Hydrocarboniclastica marina]